MSSQPLKWKVTQVGFQLRRPAASKAMLSAGPGVLSDLVASASTIALSQGSRGFHKVVPWMKLEGKALKCTFVKKQFCLEPGRWASSSTQPFWWPGYLCYLDNLLTSPGLSKTEAMLFVRN